MDLYARDDELPTSLEAALERKNDLLFGNQTYLRLKDKIAIRKLERRIGGEESDDDEINLLSYRAGVGEPGPEKSFNFARPAIGARWHAGFEDMCTTLDADTPAINGLRVVRGVARRSALIPRAAE